MGSRGFSLVEMLVVLMVVVLITGLATLGINAGGGNREAEDFFANVAATVSYALDEASFSGSDYGLLLAVDPDAERRDALALQWRQRLPAGWRLPEQSNDVFRTLRLPVGVEQQLVLDGVAVTPADAAASNPANGTAPQWLFTAAGETQGGELILMDEVSGDTIGRLTWDALGRFETYRGDDSEPVTAYAP